MEMTICPHCGKTVDKVGEFMFLRLKNKNPPHDFMDLSIEDVFHCPNCKKVYIDPDEFKEILSVKKTLTGNTNFEPYWEKLYGE